MQSLFNQKHAQEFISRINNLNDKTQPQWGKMNVSQMLGHCQVTLKMATGEVRPKVNPIVRFLFAKSAKKQLIQDPEFKRNLPTITEAKIRDKKNFEEERKKLVNLIERFQETGPAVLINEPHPFFGPLSVNEWDTLQVKHLDHHLRQFGV